MTLRRIVHCRSLPVVLPWFAAAAPICVQPAQVHAALFAKFVREMNAYKTEKSHTLTGFVIVTPVVPAASALFFEVDWTVHTYAGAGRSIVLPREYATYEAAKSPNKLNVLAATFCTENREYCARDFAVSPEIRSVAPVPAATVTWPAPNV